MRQGDGASAKLEAPPEAEKPGVHVPGAAATPVDAGKLWGAMTRWLLRSGTSLAIFVKSFLGNSPWEFQGTAHELWPMAAPYPELFDEKNATLRREVLRRRQAVNLIVLTLSWLHLGKPKRCPAPLSRSSKLSAAQWKIVVRIEDHAADVLQVGVVGPAEMGRGAAKVESLEELISVLEQKAHEVCDDSYGGKRHSVAYQKAGPAAAAGEVIGKLVGASAVVAKAIEPERLSLPTAPPAFDPTPLLPRKHREVFQDPVSLADPVDPFVDNPPKVRVHASRAQVMELLKRLDSSSRVVLAKPEEVRETHLCGAFALVKDALQDRLILDARPPNSKEQTLDAWCKTLASCHTLALQELEPGHVMYFSGTDLKDYYHAFKVSTARAHRNALAFPLSAAEAQQLSCFSAEHVGCQKLYPCLSALAMGDNQAVEIGQLAHIQLGLKARAFSPFELLVVHGRAPRSRIAAGIVIDDAIFCEQRPGEDLGELESVRRLNMLCEEYLQQGLLAHPKKTFRAETSGEFWGCLADGVSGRVRANPKRLVPLVDITLQTARLGVATVQLLEILAGGWISVLQMRRRMLCLVNFLYAAQRGRAQNDVVRLSSELVEELFVLAILAPMAAADMRAPSLSEVFMSDASEWGTASVRAKLPKVLAQEFQRHALNRGAWSKLLSPWKTWLKMHDDLFPADELPDGVPLVSHPLWLLLAEVLHYEVNHAKKTRSHRHINLLELQSVLEVELKLAQRRGCCRYLLGADSQVTLAALVKGRSASPRLNEMLQRSLAVLLGSGLFGAYGFVPSLANPSDDPTRGAKLRAAFRDLPDWWEAAEAGDFSGLDNWLAGLGYDPLQLAEVPLSEAADKRDLIGQMLADLVRVQKPERLARFREATSDLFTTSPVEVVSQPQESFHHSSCTDARSAKCTEAVDRIVGSCSCSDVSPQLNSEEHTRGHKSGERQTKNKKKRQKKGMDEPTSKAVGLFPEQSPTAKLGKKKGKPRTGSHEPPLVARAFEALPWNPKVGYLRAEAKGALAAFGHAQFVLPDGRRAGPEFKPETRGFLDLYSGAAGVAKAVARTFGTWVLTFDFDRGPEQDLLQPSLREQLLQLVRMQAFLGVGMAPECASFSRAVCPPVRSRTEPWGFAVLSPNMTEKVKRGNSHAKFCASLVRLCIQLELPFWLENPDSSFLWLLPDFLDNGIGWAENSYRVDFCRFSTPWRKRTRVATNTGLAGVAELCLRDHQHLVLRGRSSFHKLPWTRVAQVYPKAFCVKMGRALGLAAGLRPLGKQAKLALAKCAHAGESRIGEASHPGPVSRRVERDVNVLLGVPLVNPGTQRLQHRVWSDFQQWLAAQFSEETINQLFLCPALAVEVLRSYGVELYRSGHALYELRHLLALVQKMHPAVKPLLSTAWALVTQWEEINPVQHRQPLPEMLYKAMFSVAWMWGWKRFSAVLLLGFEGIARVGELLRARRSDLVLPSDLGDPDLKAVFLKIRKPKSMRRGKGRVQHVKVSNPSAVNFLERVYSDLEDFLLLFPLSAAAFRARWQKLLLALGLPKHLQPTPGSLRGGGAIAAYRRGESIQSIMWRMRLVSISTLESYLQELAAETFMSQLPVAAKSKIRSAALFFPLAIGHSV